MWGIASCAKWGGLAEIGDVWAHQFCIGPLSKMEVEYGDKLKLSGLAQETLREWGPNEGHQCAVVSLESALEWKSQIWRKRIPPRTRVLLLAYAIREADLNAAARGDHLESATNECEAVIDAALHGISTSNHARDLRTLGLYLLNDAMREIDADLCILEENPSGADVAAHLYQASEEGPCGVIYMKAFRNHMRWEDPSDEARPNVCRCGESNDSDNSSSGGRMGRRGRRISAPPAPRPEDKVRVLSWEMQICPVGKFRRS